MFHVVLGQEVGELRLQRPQLVEALEVVDLEGVDVAVVVLGEDEPVEHADRAGVDQRREFGDRLAGEVGLTGRELDYQVVDRPSSSISTSLIDVLLPG